MRELRYGKNAQTIESFLVLLVKIKELHDCGLKIEGRINKEVRASLLSMISKALKVERRLGSRLEYSQLQSTFIHPQNGGKSTCLAAFITSVGFVIAVVCFTTQSHAEILVCLREEEKKWLQQNV